METWGEKLEGNKENMYSNNLSWHRTVIIITRTADAGHIKYFFGAAVRGQKHEGPIHCKKKVTDFPVFCRDVIIHKIDLLLEEQRETEMYVPYTLICRQLGGRCAKLQTTPMKTLVPWALPSVLYTYVLM